MSIRSCHPSKAVLIHMKGPQAEKSNLLPTLFSRLNYSIAKGRNHCGSNKCRQPKNSDESPSRKSKKGMDYWDLKNYILYY